jgi:pimeloyl-ACP methyl ester carboxylesterase
MSAWYPASLVPRSLPSVLKSLLVVAGLVLCVYAGLLLILWARQERIVFQPPGSPFEEAATELVRYTASDGQSLFGYLVSSAKAGGSGTEARDSNVDARPSTVLLVFHGNAEIAAWSLAWAREVARRTGATVLLAEYRGYAGLPGRPTYATSKLDARAAWEYLRTTHGATPERTAIYGHSLGSAIGVELAAEIKPRVLLLEAPFTSARAMAARLGVPGILPLWRAISRVHYDTRTRVADLDVPVWVVHGELDMVTPVHMGREVYAAARRRGELLVLEDVGHNDVVETGGERYWSWLERGVAVASIERPETASPRAAARTPQ